MTEYLALPAWDTPPKTVEAWIACLSEAGGPVVVRRESSSVAWLEVDPLRIRGYALIENGRVAAINFELLDRDHEAAAKAIEAAASSLGYEVHEDDEDEDSDPED